MTSSAGINSIGMNLNQLRVSKRPEPVSKPAKVFDSQPKKSNFRNALGNLAGFALGIATPVYILHDNLHKITVDEMKDSADSMKEILPDVDTFENTKINAEKILKDTGLDKKGVKLHFVNNTEAGQKELQEVLNSAIPQTNSLNRRLYNNMVNTYKEGANAAYLHGNGQKAILVNSDQLYCNVYHELGHAMNFNTNIFSKALVKARHLTPFGASIVAPFAVLTSLLHRPNDTKPQKEKPILERTLDFVSRHPVTLTALSVLPIVTEEALASFRGLKQANKYLKPEIVGKLAQNYTIAWMTYGVVAIGTVAGAKLGTYVADRIKNPKNDK